MRLLRGPAGHVVLCLAIAGIGLAVLAPTLDSAFVFDDFVTVLNNRLIDELSVESLAALFGGIHVYDYYPVFYLSLAIDRRLWDLDPGGFHRTNLVLHIVNALLVYALVHRIAARSRRSTRSWPNRGRWMAAFAAAALFALHPNHVEPVAWITGRKVLLACLLGLLAIHAYLGSLTERGRRPLLVIVSLLCAALACMSNVYAIVVPALIVLVDHLFAPRSWWRAAWINSPFGLVACGAVVLKITSRPGGVARTTYFDTRTEWLLTTVSLYWQNVRSLWETAGRNALYPNRVVRSIDEPAFLAGVAAIAITLAMVWFARRHHVWLFAILWFVLALIPTSQVARHHIFRADRYLYFPGIGVCLLAGLVLGTVWSCCESKSRRIVASLLAAAALAFGGVQFGLASHARTKDWHTPETLWSASLAQDEENPYAHESLGWSLMVTGRLDEALEHLNRSVELLPSRPEAHNTLAALLLRLNRPDDAIRHARRAVEIRPDYTEAKFYLARALLLKGALVEALRQFESAIAQEPTNIRIGVVDWRPQARYYMAETLAGLERHHDAIRAYETALAMNPSYVKARYGLAVALMRTGQSDRAANELTRLVTAHPELAKAHCLLAELALARDDFAEAVARYRQAIKGRPDLTVPRNNLAWLLATCRHAGIRDGAEAVEVAKVLVADPDRALPRWWDTLAAAHAEAGEFDQAVQAASRALELATDQGDQDQAAEFRQRLQLYTSGKPYRESTR